MTRTPLAQRTLPAYSRKNEIANMTSHIVGGGMGLLILAAVLIMYVIDADPWLLAGGMVYAFSMICLYTVSSVYHGLRHGMAKKVMQVIDHCAIYFLIAGTYTPILLCALRPQAPVAAWSVLIAEWLLAAVGTVFTAIDHKRYSKFSMSCYLGMGWLALLIIRPVYRIMGFGGFMYILAGGLLYSLGAVIYAMGGKRPYLHTVFHIFTLLGTALQAIAVLFYVF